MESMAIKYHENLADYFSNKWPHFDKRAIIELPYQHSRNKVKGQDALKNIYKNLVFLYYSICHRQVHELLGDFRFLIQLTEEHSYFLQFLRQHLSVLDTQPKQFFNLLYHVGDRDMKHKVREKCFNTINIDNLLVTEKVEVADGVPDEPAKGCHIKLDINKNIKSNNNLTIATKKQWVFYTEQIGTLSGFDLEKGRQIHINIDLPRKRAERIVLSPEGSHVLSAYDDGRLFIYSLKRDESVYNVSIKGNKIAELNYRLPEYEDPVFKFHESSLFYQGTGGELKSFHLKKMASDTIINLMKNDVELVWISTNNSYKIICFRSEGHSILNVMKDRQVVYEKNYNDEIKCVSSLFDDEFIVLLTNKTLVHYKITDDALENIREVRLSEMPHMCTGRNGQIVIFVLPDKMYLYDAGGNLKSVENIPDHLGIPADLGALADETFAFSSPKYITKFYINTGDYKRKREYISILQNPVTKQHWIREKVEHMQQIINIEEKKIFKLNHRLEGFVSEFLDTIDGYGNILHVWFEGGGEYYDNKMNQWNDINQIPECPISILGNEEEGFWVGTQDGSIYFGHPRSGWQHVYQENEPIKGIGPLRRFGRYIIWEGIVIKAGAQGTDFKLKLTFLSFNKKTGQLNPSGSRIFSSHNGLLGPMTYDPQSGKYYVFLFSDIDEYQGVRFGSAEDFIQGKEILKPVEGLTKSIRYCQKIPNQNICYIVTTNGCLALVDLTQFKLISALTPNHGFSNMVRNQIEGDSILVNDSASVVYSCHLYKKG